MLVSPALFLSFISWPPASSGKVAPPERAKSTMYVVVVSVVESGAGRRFWSFWRDVRCDRIRRAQPRQKWKDERYCNASIWPLPPFVSQGPDRTSVSCRIVWRSGRSPQAIWRGDGTRGTATRMRERAGSYDPTTPAHVGIRCVALVGISLE